MKHEIVLLVLVVATLAFLTACFIGYIHSNSNYGKEPYTTLEEAIKNA